MPASITQRKKCGWLPYTGIPIFASAKTEKKYGKMTTAYYNGGAQNAIETLNKNFDLQITDYVTFNWGSCSYGYQRSGWRYGGWPESMFKDNMINGYITFTVDATGIGSHHLKGPGEQLLDGIQAVSYCRIRYISGMTTEGRSVSAKWWKMLQKAKSADIGTLKQHRKSCFPSDCHQSGAAFHHQPGCGCGQVFHGSHSRFPHG